MVTSVPTKHNSSSTDCHLDRVRDLLSIHCKLPQDENSLAWEILLQASSMRAFDKNFIKVLSCSNQESEVANFKIVFPSKENVRSNRYGAEGEKGLFYQEDVHKKQLWINKHLQFSL